MSKLTVFNIDFSEYEGSEGGGSVKIPEGDYLARFVDVEQITVKNEQSENFGKPGFLVKLEIVGGEFNGLVIQDRFYILKKTLFRLDQFFSAFGVKIDKTMMNIPVAQVLNRTVCLTVKDGEPFGEKQTVKSEVKRYSHASNYKTGVAVEAPETPQEETSVVSETHLEGNSNGKVLDSSGLSL